MAEDLKLGKYQLPTWDALVLPTLQAMAGRQEWPGKQLKEKVVDSLNLSPEQQERRYPDRDVRIILDRAGWALSKMTLAGILLRVSRGHYRMAELGKQLLINNQPLSQNDIHNLPKFKQHQAELNERKRRDLDGSKDYESVSPDGEEDLSRVIKAYNNEVETDLLERIRHADPSFFENLVVRLLAAMGYKGPNGSAIVTQPSHDDGIDGIINQDALGTRKVYVQAKRYNEDHRVQRPEIDSFSGVLKRKHADSGVFMTTSKFSEGAVAAAKNAAIITVDGISLTHLMLQYHVGVQVKKRYELFEIDEDFFNED